jgi:4-hydroxymandelate oxidase
MSKHHTNQEDGKSSSKTDEDSFTISKRTLLTGALGLAAATGAYSTSQTANAQNAPAPESEDFESIGIPVYSDEIMSVTNLHEFEDVGKKKISQQAYNYVRAGAADELTLEANRAAFGEYWIRRRSMVDVSHVDCSIELFGETYPHPVILGPVGLRRLMHPDADRLTLLAAHKSEAIVVGPNPSIITELAKENKAPTWWASSLGHANRSDAENWAKEQEALGASALCVSLDYPYSGARDRPSRDHWETQWTQDPTYNTSGGKVTFQAGQMWPYVPSMNWQWFEWVKNVTKLPIVAKGITSGADAQRAVAEGADAIAVSNHGGRTLDGALASLHALPAVVDAVDGNVPVLVGGGVRRGGDVVKAAALGARAVIIGRPYLWALAAFGQEGVQRCIEVLEGETRIALGLSLAASLRDVDRSFIRESWQPRSV